MVRYNDDDDDDEEEDIDESEEEEEYDEDDDDEEDDEEDEIDESPEISFRDALLALASSRLDSSIPSERESLVRQVNEQILDSDEDDSVNELASGLAMEAVKCCTSIHGNRRICRTLALAIYQCCLAKEKDETVDDGAIVTLCEALCFLIGRDYQKRGKDQRLEKRKQCSLIALCLMVWDGKEVLQPLRPLSQGEKMRLAPTFLTVARQNTKTAQLFSGAGPALSFLSYFITMQVDDTQQAKVIEWRTEAMDIFLTLSLTGGRFATPTEIKSSQLFLSSISQDEFDSSLASVLGSKLRATPESSMETIRAIVSALDKSRIDASQHLSDGGTSSAKLLPAVMKQLKSNKSASPTMSMCASASSLLFHLAILSANKGPLELVISTLCEALAGKKPATSLSTPDQRIGGYETLLAVATGLFEPIGPKDGETEIAISLEIIDQVLSSLAAALSKESTPDGGKLGTPSAATVGMDALLAWMFIAKRKAFGASTDLTGYGAALSYLSKPIMGGSKAIASSSDFRFRIGSLVLHHKGKDFVESVLADIFFRHGDAKILTSSLQSFVELADKKHSTAAIVAQVDGLLATFLLLLIATSSSSGLASLPSLPASVLKALEAGASATGKPIKKLKKQPSSFLYCKAMYDAAATDALVGNILHRVVAMYCKFLSKTREQKTDGSSESVSLVQSFDDGRWSAGSVALAYCIANPHHSVSSSSWDGLRATIKTILTYSSDASSASGAMASALFASINDMSNRDMIAAAAINDTREARDRITAATYDTNPSSASTSQPSKLSRRGQLSETSPHRNYDSTTTRKAALIIAKESSSLLKREDINANASLAKLLLLIHTGTTPRPGHRRQRAALVEHTVNLFHDLFLPLTKRSNPTSSEEGWFDATMNLISVCSSRQSFPTSPSLNETEGIDSEKAFVDKGKKEVTKKTKNKADTAMKESSDEIDSKDENEETVSVAIRDSALSLLSTLAIMAGKFDPEYDDLDDEESQPFALANKLCVEEIAPRLADNLVDTLQAVEELCAKDIDLYKSLKGTLYKEGSDSSELDSSGEAAAEKSQNSVKKRAGGKSRKKGDFGAGFEEEEWERQMKKELSSKKKRVDSENTLSGPFFSEEEKALILEQDRTRSRVSRLIDGDFRCVLDSIKCLCSSEIEVGNVCLPILGPSVIAAVVSTSLPFEEVMGMHETAFATLTSLALCVFEIEEDYAVAIGRALAIAYRRNEGNNGRKTPSPSPSSSATAEKKPSSPTASLSVLALPSPCESAAKTIFEMNEFGDSLCGPSFAFLFPILRAALTGPRTSPGCESALKVLFRHTPMLSGEDANESVKPLRKDMAITVLELISHDRFQTFSDPTPTEALVAIYSTEGDDRTAQLTTSELSPLLGEKGALGGKSGRVASMTVLGSIAETQNRFVKNNPLIENRIWLNCFAKDESVRISARRTWRVASGEIESSDVVTGKEESPLPHPSKMYAVPLLPLLHHADVTIAKAAANAFAHGMGMHPDSIEKMATRLCATYIDAYPTFFEEEAPRPKLSKPVAAAPVAAAPKKKTTKISTGLPTKKMGKKSLAGGSVISKLTTTATKKKVVKPTIPKAAARPEKMEFNKALFESQFKSESTRKVDAEKDSESRISIRTGVVRVVAATTDSSASVSFDIGVLKLLVGFLMAYGLADGNEAVRGDARNAIRDVVATNGSSDEAIAFLLPQFESVLSTGKVDEETLGTLNATKVLRDIDASDRRKEGAVVALGSVALHLKGEENFDKIDNSVDMLVSALRTPSEGVQSSVAQCLSKLMKKGRTPDRVDRMLIDLMKECLRGDTLASRRGAAYGISAVVKGSGIASLKKFEVIPKLEKACDDGTGTEKEGALFAIELLSDRLGLLFEPYVIVLLPALLRAFSDSSDFVRKAADHTASLIMSKLSGHGVKLVMPAVLQAFDDPAWRTKQASIRMLGSMSHCAPKQLAACLPKIVPKLVEAFSDTHPKVKGSAEEALDEISKVIRNPEVASISAVLLVALTDPASGTTKALEELIETEFVHAIDAPSLALIVPVLHRGLRDRAATTKRYGALIAGNICTMINDPKDFVPYLPTLLPDLKSVLLDPIPDVRSTSAKAIGSLVRGLGEATFPDLRPWLIDTLRSEGGTSVERSGGAQGLTELLVAGGVNLVDTVMRQEILPLRSHPKASTREGVLWVLTFLPSSLGHAFAPLIDSSLPALLSGLSDDSEPVRDVALRAGRVLIRSHGKAHFEKVLPSLENGLTDEDYRIRVASLTLLGDLLSMIGGTKVVKGDADTQEDIRQAERAQAQIALVLGSDTRKRVLSGLYLARSDTAAVVRQSAVQVWKTVVSVTARTLREILGMLVGLIVDALASGHPDQTQVAGRCLGDIVQKLGDSVLPEIIPVLRDALYRGDVNTRRGVCVGLSEVIGCSSKEQIIKFLPIIVKAVQDALCDEDDGVRQMAASCFQSLYGAVGSRALDEVVPALLVAMENSEMDEVSRSRAVNGLTGILSIRSKELLPYLIPRLMQRPITMSHADALSSIASVTGKTLHLHFSTIIPGLLFDLAEFYGKESDEDEKSREESVRTCAHAVCGGVDDIGVNWLISEIASKCGSDKDSLRKESCWMFEVVVTERKDEADFYEQVPVMLRELLYRLNDESPMVLKAANSALKSLSNNVPAEELVTHLEFIRNLINSMVSDARRRKGGVGDGEFLLPGFNMPKGLEPMMPIYQRGILYGNASIREVSAAGLGELISLIAGKYLAGPFIIKMTGPLLRIVGDRNPPAVKIAIIKTLGLILTKGGPALRAFVPQFQTTFVKSLSDPSRQVRLEAIKALALLMPLSTRVDPLIKELVSGSLGKGSGSSADTAGIVAIQTATSEALAVVLRHGGKKAKLPESVPSALDAGRELLFHEDEGVREGAAKVLGASCGLLGAETAAELFQDVIFDSSKPDSSEKRHGEACACRQILASGVGSELDSNLFGNIIKLVNRLMKDENSSVREAACIAVGAVLGSASDTASCRKQVDPSILKCLDPSESMELHKSLARGLALAVKMKSDIFSGEGGLPVMNGALKLAMSGTQRVQLAFNDFLWLALDVASGDFGLEEYASYAHFENTKTMRSLYSKVLVRIKDVDFED